MATKKPVPGKLGAKIDHLYALEVAIEKLTTEYKSKVALLQAKYDKLEEELFNEVTKDELEGAAGKTAKVVIKRDIVATVSDWEVFCRYLVRNKSFDLITRKVSNPAYRARLEAGKQVPGLTPFTKVSIHLSKLK